MGNQSSLTGRQRRRRTREGDGGSNAASLLAMDGGPAATAAERPSRLNTNDNSCTGADASEPDNTGKDPERRNVCIGNSHMKMEVNLRVFTGRYS